MNMERIVKLKVKAKNIDWWRQVRHVIWPALSGRSRSILQRIKWWLLVGAAVVWCFILPYVLRKSSATVCRWRCLTFIPKASILWATCLPILPRPSTASVLPLSSVPMNSLLWKGWALTSVCTLYSYRKALANGDKDAGWLSTFFVALLALRLG